MKKFYIHLTLLSLLFIPGLYPQWSSDPNTNLLISDLNGEQVLPKISLTSDGGCYIAWFDTRTGNYNVYLQRLDAAGNKMFANDGLLISDNPSSTWIVDWDMMTDNSDNAVIAFSDIRSGVDFKVYAYLISPTGNFLWGPNGVSLSTSEDFQPNPRITQTTDGYYIITWPNLSTPSKIAVQKLDAVGNKLYGNDPLYIESGTNEQYTYPIPIPGINGSYIIGFEGTTGSYPVISVHLYAQKYSSAGAPQWGSSPVTVSNASEFPFYELTNIIPDGNYGVVFVWYDDRDFNNIYSSFVQRIDSSGSVLFTTNGVEMSSLASNHHLNPDVVIDPSTYEIYTFWIEQDNNQTMAGISGQKLSSTGTILWGNNGMTFKPMDSNTDLHMSALFMGGNEYVYYLEYVGGLVNNLAKAFSVDGDGNFNWSGNIVTFSSVISPKSRLVSDIYFNGASVLAWSDGRQDNGGIYAQNINQFGQLGDPVTLLNESGQKSLSFILEQNYPNPFNPTTKISWQLPEGNNITLKIFNAIGEEIQTVVDNEFQEAGAHSSLFIVNSSLPSGIYFYQLRAGSFIETKKMILLK
jgi:hypothetical protein